MQAELPLADHKFDPSYFMDVPRGYRRKTGSNEFCIYAHAIDPDGFVWCGIDGRWFLWITAFDERPNGHDFAVCRTAEGADTWCPIDDDGSVITPRGERITDSRWYH